MSVALAAKPRSPIPDHLPTPDLRIDAVFAAWDTKRLPGLRPRRVPGRGDRVLAAATAWRRSSTTCRSRPSRCSTRVGVEAVHGDGGGAGDPAGEARATTIRSASTCPSCRPMRTRSRSATCCTTRAGCATTTRCCRSPGRRDEDAWDNRVVLQMTARQTQLNFTPGDEYLYSNTGYTLLATIVERATGRSSPRLRTRTSSSRSAWT